MKRSVVRKTIIIVDSIDAAAKVVALTPPSPPPLSRTASTTQQSTFQFPPRRRKSCRSSISNNILLPCAASVLGVLIRRPSFQQYHHRNVKQIRNKLGQQDQKSFPVSFDYTGDDAEEVAHPAIQYGATIPEGLPKTLILPKFWNPPKFGGDVRQYLGHGALLTPEKAASIGSFYHRGDDSEQHETILVGIASYRDPECRKTVQNLYLRAKHPLRIRTVVVDQLRAGDASCLPSISELEPSCQENPKQVI